MANEFKVKNGLYVSGSTTITEDTAIAGSLTVSSGITGSLYGTASWAENVVTASYAETALSSSYAITASYALFAINGGSGGGSGYAVTHSQAIAATTWSFTHNLNTRIPLVQVYDLSYEQIIPNEIVNINVLTTEIRFDYAQAGYAVASTGGSLAITGSTSRVIQSIPATTWSFSHNLGTKYPGFEVYNSNDDVIIPAGIHVVDEDNAEIYFANPTSGTAIANFSGINGLSDNAVSASYALNSDLLDGRDSSVFATTGSNIFRGNQIITGSLNITGSTTQIGNNNLLGNTILSGSIIISGSFGTNNPTVQIYGDTTHNGYIRFDPVNTNVDTSISASYIYVSGSTSDLYFSQNGEGYSNVTRLRWLEGNLYTGLLHGGVISAKTSTTYQISSGSGIIVSLNSSLNDDPFPTIQYLNWPNLSASIAPLTASYQQAFVGIDSTGNIFAQGTPFSNGQFDVLINIGNVLFQNQSTINGVKTQPSVAYGFQQAQNTFNRAFGPLKLSGYTLAPSGSSTRSLIVGSGTAYAPGANYTIDPNEPYYSIDSGTNVSKIFRYYQSGSSWVYLTNGGAGYTTIDPTQYSNNGTLTGVGGSNWSIQRVFYFPNSVTKAIVVYYGNAVYPTEAEALANISFERFVEAPNTAANAIYLGAIIINRTGEFTTPASFTIYPGGLFRQVGGSGGGGSTVTQTLSGLSDVLISGPTNGQALVYDSTAAKWENKSSINASITGNATTATTAATASYSDAFHIGQTQTKYATVASSINGSNTIFNQTTGSYTSAFFKYTVSKGVNARSGEIMSVWNGTTVAFTDNSTTDIGSTTPVTASVVISGVNVRLNMQTNTSGWKVKSIATFM